MKTLTEIDKMLLKIFQKLYNKNSKNLELPDKIILPLEYGEREKGEVL